MRRILYGKALVLSATVACACATRIESSPEKIEGVEFKYDKNSREWTSVEDLPNLGIDLRDVKLPISKPSPQQSAQKLFRPHKRSDAKAGRELDDSRHLSVLYSLFAQCNPGYQGPTYECIPKSIDTSDPCGFCQTEREVFVFSRTTSGDDVTEYCDKFIECVDTSSGDCSKATENCFQTGCPPDYMGTSGYPWAGLCHRSIQTGTCGGETDHCLGGACPDSRHERRLQEFDFEEMESRWVLDEETTSRSFIGFVRIPKTGSTTLLRFLDKQKYMLQWNSFVDGESLISNTADTPRKRRKNRKQGSAGPSGGCIFGRPSSKQELEDIKGRSAWWNACPHLPFGKLVEQWARSLALWSPPQGLTAVDERSTSDLEMAPIGVLHSDYTMTLQTFTMVRDPFDRLTSYFFYLRKFSYTNNFLMDTVTMSQYKFVEDNNLEGWLRQLHLENGGRGLELPYQYKYLHEDVEEAIKLIKNDGTPQVYTLITECYEVSLRLLAHNLGHFDHASIDKFTQSEDFESNNNRDLYKEKPDQEELARIRKKAEVWFADDFKFYDAAVEEFRAKMAASMLDSKLLETCSFWNGVESS